jgi:dihydroorotate dehydrogenase (fumarate)
VDIPVIASLNGSTPGGWIRYAKLIEEAGADALELNIYLMPGNLDAPGAEIEAQYRELVKDVRHAVRIPLAVKLSHQFSAVGHFARTLVKVGANGLVLFNRFYQPDLDIEALEVLPTLALSTPDELPLRLTWAAILYGRIEADLAITGGVHEARDVLKAVMAGASIAQMASAILRHGIPHLARVRRELHAWMEAREYGSIEQMRGSLSQRAIRNPETYERANYLRVLSSYALT